MGSSDTAQLLPRVGTGDGGGGGGEGCGGVLPRSGSSTRTRVHQHLLDPLLFFTQQTHKETSALLTLIRGVGLGIGRRGEDTCVVLSPETRKSRLGTRCHAEAGIVLKTALRPKPTALIPARASDVTHSANLKV